MRKSHLTIILLAAAILAYGTGMTGPSVTPNAGSGILDLGYDNGVRFKKIGYPTNGVGWGVKLNVTADPTAWLKINTLAVNLCPPPEGDAAYEEEVQIVLANGEGGAPGTVAYAQAFPVRVGEWWHYITVETDMWVQGPFYVFSLTKTGYSSLFQWFDATDDAPTGTQWYYNGTTYEPYHNPTCGDIEIRARVEIHDVAVTEITRPVGEVGWGMTITPTVVLTNLTQHEETDVPVRLWITPEGWPTPVYDTTIAVNLPGSSVPRTVTFPGTAANWQPGNYRVHCRNLYYHDYDPTNDEHVGTFSVQYFDAGTEEIETPQGMIAEGTTIIPRAHVYNAGTSTATFPVTLTIPDAGYSCTKTISDLPPGWETQIDFDPWVAAPEGEYVAVCATALAGDQRPENNEVFSRFTVTACKFDAGATALISPTGTITTGDRVPLVVRVRNFGACPSTFDVACVLMPPTGYPETYTATVTDLAPFATTDVQFVDRTYREVGDWSVFAYTQLHGDENPENDTGKGDFHVVSGEGWFLLSARPLAQPIERGAALTADPRSNVYLLTGKKTPTIYRYDQTDAPRVISVPGDIARQIGYGTSMVYAADRLYLLTANRGLAFHRLDLATGNWSALSDIPLGPSRKPARAGAAMTIVGNRIYALKGNGTTEFYCYDAGRDAWLALPDIPRDDKRGVKDGAALGTDGSRIYALKGGSKLFYTYDIAGGVWQQLAPLPRKTKAGAAMSCLKGIVYATVGGNYEFYAFDPVRNVWTRQKDVPGDNGRKPTAGASMTALRDMIVFEKGRKSDVLYTFEPDPQLFGARPPTNAAGHAGTAVERVSITNPVRSSVRIPIPGTATVRLYNGTGSLIRAGRASGSWELDVAGLANGVYVLRITSEDKTTTHNLVVER